MNSPTSQLEFKTTVILIWKTVFITLALISLATAFIEIEGFWSSYVFDIVFPAYLYIFFRGLFRADNDGGSIIGYFSAESTLALLFGVTFVMETCQYLGIYKGYFDPLDYIAYISILFPCYIFDIYLGKIRRRRLTST